MAQTLNQILADIAAWIDQDTTLATGTELTVRVNLANQALREWGDAYQWKSLRVPNQAVTFALSATSVGLPSNFKKLMSPLVDVSTSANYAYPELSSPERFKKVVGDRWCVVGGNEVSGKYLMLPGLASGVSLTYDYQSYPSSMATLQDICVCPQPQFVSKRAVGLILEQRADSRFPQIKADAETMLRTMMEEEDAPSGGQNNRVPDWARSTGFRIGGD